MAKIKTNTVKQGVALLSVYICATWRQNLQILCGVILIHEVWQIALVFQGPMHCLPVSTPYITKAHTETKRSKALALETTYAYDFPDLFKNSMIDIWRTHRSKYSSQSCQTPLDSEVCSYQELVLDEDGKSVTEGHCYPGEYYLHSSRIRIFVATGFYFSIFDKVWNSNALRG